MIWGNLISSLFSEITNQHLRLWKREQREGNTSFTPMSQDSCIGMDARHSADLKSEQSWKWFESLTISTIVMRSPFTTRITSWDLSLDLRTRYSLSSLTWGTQISLKSEYVVFAQTHILKDRFILTFT